MNSTGDDTAATSFFVWDENLSTCVPKDHTCDPPLVNTGINSNGVVECRNIADWVDMSKFIDTSSSNCVGKQAKLSVGAGGKIKIDCL